MLASALKAPNLKRLTVMSSFASVVDLDKNPRAGYVYTDKDWDPVTLEKGSEDGFWGYHASKTFAERKAWDIWNEAKPSWDLVTFCPPMIYGPPIQEIDAAKGIVGMNTSAKRLLTGITGKDPAFAPKVSTPGLPAWWMHGTLRPLISILFRCPKEQADASFFVAPWHTMKMGWQG